MVQLIDKDALVAEIERRIKEIEEIGTYLSPKGTLTNLLCYINTLEVEEVDLEEEMDKHWDEWAKADGFHSTEFAKHFFELGMKVAQKGE